MKLIGIFLFIPFSVTLIVSSAYTASMITDASIYATTGAEVLSGNGTMNFILFMGDGNGENEEGGFDGDDANKDMPYGSSILAHESFITSIGELRTFYRLCFPDGHGGSLVKEVVIYVDLVQEPGNSLYVDELTIVRDYVQTFGDSRDNPWTNDISSSKQNLINASYSGGTILSQLDAFPKTLAPNSGGAIWADYGIETGINPFDPTFSDADRILFHWQSYGHSGEAETIFLSGEYQGIAIPEPAMAILFLSGFATLVWKKRK